MIQKICHYLFSRRQTIRTAFTLITNNDKIGIELTEFSGSYSVVLSFYHIWNDQIECICLIHRRKPLAGGVVSVTCCKVFR